MVSFTCQLAWAMESPEIWSNIIIGASLRMFLDAINTWFARLNKADCPLKYESTSPNQLKVRIEQKEHKKEGTPPVWMLDLRHQSFTVFGSELKIRSTWVSRASTTGSPVYQAFSLGLKQYHWLSWVAGSQLQILELLTLYIITWTNSL